MSGWILLSERLPERPGEFVVTDGTIVGAAIYLGPEAGAKCWQHGLDKFESSRLTHWQPLPAPPPASERLAWLRGWRGLPDWTCRYDARADILQIDTGRHAAGLVAVVEYREDGTAWLVNPGNGQIVGLHLEGFLATSLLTK